MATFRLSGTQTLAAPAAITPVVGDLFVVFVYATGNTNTSPTCVDDNGGVYSLITAQLLNSSADTLSAFVRTSFLANTTATTVTPSVGTATNVRITTEAISGMTRAGLGAILQFAVQANRAATTTPAPAFAASAQTSNLTIGAVASAATLTAPTSWTPQTSGGKLQVVTRDSGFTGTTITWGSTDAEAYAAIIVELDTTPPVIDDLFVPGVVVIDARRAIADSAYFSSSSRPWPRSFEEQFAVPVPSKALTQFPPDGYRLGLIRMSVGLGYLSDVEYYAATPLVAAPQLVEADGFAMRPVYPWSQWRDTRFVDLGELPVATPATFDALASSPSAGKGPLDPGHQVVSNPINVTLTATAGGGGGADQTSGSISVAVYDSYGSNVISSMSTTGVAGWTERGWLLLSGGIWTNVFTRANVPVGSYALTFQVNLGLNEGFVYITTSGLGVPTTSQATGVGNNISVHIYAS